MKFPFYSQPDTMGCGPTCLRMILKHYGRLYSYQTLAERCHINTHGGVSMLGISDAAETVGLRTSAVRLGFDQLVNEVSLPCIVNYSPSLDNFNSKLS